MSDQPVATHPRVQRAILDALPSSVALLDGAGRIVAVNAAWRRFAAANGCASTDLGLGANYLEACDRATGRDSAEAGSVADGIRAVIRGDAPDFELEYPSHLPERRRWFLLRATPVEVDGERGAVVLHVDVSTRREAEAALGRVNDLLEQRVAERTASLSLANEALRESEEQYRAIFDATADAVLVTTLPGGDVPDAGELDRIVEANPAASAMLGYSRQELIGRSILGLVASEHRHLTRGFTASAQASQPAAVSAEYIRRDGTRLHVHVHGMALTYHGRDCLLRVVRDVTEEVERTQLLEQRVAERTSELRALLDVSHSVASTLQLKPLLGLILDSVKAVVEYDAAALFAVEEQQLRLLDFRGAGLGGKVPPVTVSLAGQAGARELFVGGEPVIVDDLRADTEQARLLRGMFGRRVPLHLSFISSWLSAPLMAKGRTIGVLGLASSTPGRYTADDARLALAIADQAAVAIENARLYEQAHALAALEERQRLARELHDSVSQAIYGIVLGVRTARTLLDRDPKRAVEPLDYVVSLADAALTEMRALIFELRPESLQVEGLVSALARQAKALQARHGITVATDLGEEPDVPLAVKQALYRVGQEAMHNALKHARASRVELSLRAEPGTLVLVVRDDGVGFDPTGEYPGHLGLRSMRERVVRLGGTLDLTSAPGEGARVSARVPVG